MKNQRDNKKQKSRAPLWAVLILALILLSVAVLFKTKLQVNDSSQQSTPTANVVRGHIETVVTATGTLQPRDYVDVGAQVSGQLTALYSDVGQEVKQGQLLAEIEPTLFKADVDATRAQLKYQQAHFKELTASLALARYQAERQQHMYTDGATSEENLKTAEAGLISASAQREMLEAQIEQTRSELLSAETRLNYARIYAPIDGTVVSLSARQGQTLNANQSAPTILQIADLSTMTVDTQVSEADISKLKVGMNAYFTTLGSQNQRWTGAVLRIEPTPTVENNVVLYNAKFDVDNSNATLLPQMTAQVSFVVAAADDALLIPASAVIYNGRSAEVLVVASDGSQQTRPVKIGISNRIQVQILDGLQQGEQVVSNAAGQQKTTGKSSGNRFPGGGMPRLH